jgi:hypothetical protein
MKALRVYGLPASLALLLAVLLLDRPAPVASPEPGFLHDPDSMTAEERQEEGHAWEMFDWWYGPRAYPNERIPASAFY